MLCEVVYPRTDISASPQAVASSELVKDHVSETGMQVFWRDWHCRRSRHNHLAWPPAQAYEAKVMQSHQTAH